MLPIERREKILAYVEQKDCVNIQELAKLCNVSHMTIRRDIKQLSNDHKLKITYGGAISNDFSFNDLKIDAKKSNYISEKNKIAEEALTLVDDGQIIILDGGSTMLAFAKMLTRKKITVITTDLKIAIYLSNFPNIDLYTTGGKVSHKTKGNTDILAINFLSTINADIAFLATSYWSLYHGVTTSSTEHFQIRKKFIAQSRKSILLAGSDKFGKYGMKTVCQLNELDKIITDNNLNKRYIKQLKEASIPLNIIDEYIEQY